MRGEKSKHTATQQPTKADGHGLGSDFKLWGSTLPALALPLASTARTARR